MVFTTFPYRKPLAPKEDIPAIKRLGANFPEEIRPLPERTSMVRKHGPHVITMMSPPHVGLPYGKLPRQLMVWIVTEAVRTQSPDIVLGKNLSEFATKIFGNRGRGGTRGSLTYLDEQARRLFSTNINITSSSSSSSSGMDAVNIRNMSITDEAMIFWTPSNFESEKPRWESTLRLNESFLSNAIKHGFPISPKIISEIASPLVIDLYIWLTYRLHHLDNTLLIRWKDLHMQLGSDPNHSNPRKLKTDIIEAIKVVLRYYPQANLVQHKDGIILKPSPPHLPMVA